MAYCSATPLASFLACCLVAGGGCTTASSSASRVLRPSNDRNWVPEMSVVSRAETSGDEVTVHNIRNCSYLSEDTFVLDHYDKTYRLSDLQTVDFIVVPFKHSPSLAHTMLSFGFRDDQYLVVSVEVRREVGEAYSPVKGVLRQYELMYVVGDERDLILLRTKHRGDDVYIYRAKAPPDRVQLLFADVMQRVNQLADQPEFYHTLTNSCTSNIVSHVNKIRPGRIPFDIRNLLPGKSDRLAYDLGLLETTLPFEETRQRARVTERAARYQDRSDFSALIRR